MSKDSKTIRKSHNVTVLLYHIVTSVKYRRMILEEDVDQVIKEVCDGIELRYDIYFLEIGTDLDHVHFLVQSVPTYSVTKLVRTIKSLIAKEVFRRCPSVKKELWGGEFFGKGYYANTVGQYANTDVIAKYVQNQGKEKEYKMMKKEDCVQLTMFD